MSRLDYARFPHAPLQGSPPPATAGWQCHTRLGTTCCTGSAAASERAPGSEPRLLVVVEPDYYVHLLAQLTLGDVAEVLGCNTSQEALSTMHERGGNVVLVTADMHLAGSILSLELAHSVIERWPGTHMVLSSGVADPTREAPASVSFIAAP